MNQCLETTISGSIECPLAPHRECLHGDRSVLHYGEEVFNHGLPTSCSHSYHIQNSRSYDFQKLAGLTWIN